MVDTQPSDRLPIVQYWHAEEPPHYIEEHFASVRAHNSSLRHLVFDEASATAFVDEHFGGRERRAFEACAVPAMQADYLRYCATFVLGGVYCDADFRCIADMRPAIPPPGAGRLFGGSGAIVNGFYAFGAPRHLLLELTVEIATANIEARRIDRVHAATGPWIFTSLLAMHRLGSFDAFVDHFADDRNGEFSIAYCEAVADYARVGLAFEQVAVSPALDCKAWIEAPEDDLPYKRTDVHWVNASRIYR